MARRVERLEDLDAVVSRLDVLEVDAAEALVDRTRKSALGQFLTPPPTAVLMASMFRTYRKHVKLLDAGAGAGALTHALVQRLLADTDRPKQISATAYELDPLMLDGLRSTMKDCQDRCKQHGVRFEYHIHAEDFIEGAAGMLRDDLFASDRTSFNTAIVNPPYRKISSTSQVRSSLSSVGIETSNLYTGFVALMIRLLEPGGELVAITPRSFCNGPYFRPFRADLMSRTALHRLHLFDSRTAAFKGDKVLQENVIYHAVVGKPAPPDLVISNSSGRAGDPVTMRRVPMSEVVDPADPELMIHLETNQDQSRAAGIVRQIRTGLKDLGLSVSTGRVVDFRAEEYIVQEPSENTVPLIYSTHFDKGFISWPIPYGRKPNAIISDPATKSLMVPRGTYVLVKRFSSKEERRRIVACIYDPDRIDADEIGFENHLNYFHRNGAGLDMSLAKGLAAYLNSTVVDQHFRRFSGHTQVNATDLRTLPYPAKTTLERIGAQLRSEPMVQSLIDQLVEHELGR
ncbi:MAG: Eco57I restriction-modification methylase domain-containing protein [Flavobacteriales bacterium]|nr:Eco57I restriction-modification methylase domain-containing protein [Flavobacteriales bacterium]